MTFEQLDKDKIALILHNCSNKLIVNMYDSPNYLFYDIPTEELEKILYKVEFNINIKRKVNLKDIWPLYVNKFKDEDFPWLLEFFKRWPLVIQ